MSCQYMLQLKHLAPNLHSTCTAAPARRFFVCGPARPKGRTAMSCKGYVRNAMFLESGTSRLNGTDILVILPITLVSSHLFKGGGWETCCNVWSTLQHVVKYSSTYGFRPQRNDKISRATQRVQYGCCRTSLRKIETLLQKRKCQVLQEDA